MRQASLLTFCIFLLLVTASGTTVAQAPVAEPDGLIEEIIVTAQKRESTAQKVPVSLYVKSGHYLEHSGIGSVGALGDLAAGVELVSENAGRVQMVVRGVTNLAYGSIDSTAAIGYYVDEIPLSSLQPNELPDIGLFDIERVEILRGPQGTLFGESSMGGTVRVITRKPDPSDFGGLLVGAYESLADGDNGFGLRVTLNAPLIDDHLAMRINLSKADLPGYIDIPDLGIEDANSMDQSYIRLALGWTPNDKLDMQLSYIDQAIDLETNHWATSRGVFDPQSKGPSGLFAPALRLSPQENRSRLFNLTVKYGFDWATFVSATSHFDLEQYSLSDLSWFSKAFFLAPGSIYFENDVPIDSLAQEFRLSSENEKLNWTAGAFFRRLRRGGGLVIESDVPYLGLLDTNASSFDVEIDSYALFGEIDYKLGNRWAVQAGGRLYRDDSRVARERLTSSVVWDTVAGEAQHERKSADDFAPSVGISWTGERNLFFMRAAKGFRAGGINVNNAYAPGVIPLQYHAEELWTYETGFKGRLWSDRLQLDAYLYFHRWDSMQISQALLGLYGYVTNAGAAEALGAEVELTVQATENLVIGALAALIDNKMKDTILDSHGDVVVEQGNSIPLTPGTKLSLTAEYSWSMTSKLDATAFARWTYRSKTYSDVANKPFLQNNSYDHVFVRLGFERGPWAAYLSVDNLFDETATVFQGFSITRLPLDFASYVQPRTVKFEVQRYF